ncbi:myomegalin [Meleagris gallopavo]|uniref:myomegalin n=1 Tax=Meleagris gallopavo TaxID=9103 RepID=UPI000549D739|nr:myomegalin [Meleagris gallopavo]
MEGLWGDCDEDPEPGGTLHPPPAQPHPSPAVQTCPSRDPEEGPLAQTQTLRDFEKHLNDLKKENFSLKLRIYFLEERVQQKGEGSRDDVYRRNIELKVEVESLKRELQEKQQALDKTWVAAENQTNRSEAALRQHYEERQRESEHVYELLENKIQLLQEEARLARSEAEQATALAKAEAQRCQELVAKLKEATRTKGDSGSGDGCDTAAQRRMEELDCMEEMLPTERCDLQQRDKAVTGQVGAALCSCRWGTGGAHPAVLGIGAALWCWGHWAVGKASWGPAAACAHLPYGGPDGSA